MNGKWKQLETVGGPEDKNGLEIFHKSRKCTSIYHFPHFLRMQDLDIGTAHNVQKPSSSMAAIGNARLQKEIFKGLNG